MRPRLTLSPLMIPPAVSRGWRCGIALLLVVWLSLAVRGLVHSLHRIHTGQPIYGHAIFNSFVIAYLVYLLIRIFLVPTAFEKEGTPRDGGTA